MAIYEEVIKCKECGEVKPHTHYKKQKRKLKDGSTSVHLDSRTCKTCTDKHSSVRNKLKRIYPYPPNNTCEKCGTNFTNHPKRKRAYLSLDHDHKTMEFRGYLCEPCNTGFGKMGDTEEGLEEGLVYLRTADKRRAEYHKKYNINENKIKSKIKVNKLSNPKVNKMEYLELLKVFVDAGELPYAMKVLNQSKGEVSKPINTTTIDTSGLPDGERLRVRAEARNKHLQPYDASKNLQPASLVHGVSRASSLLNRGDEYWNDMIQTGSLYMNEKGNKSEFLVDVDTVPEKWIKQTTTIAA